MKKYFESIYSMIFLTITMILVISLLAFTGISYIKNIVSSQFHSSKIDIQTRTQKFGNFSKIPKEYELTKAIDMFGIKAVIAEHKQTGQHLILANIENILSISKNDINSNIINIKLEKLISKFSNEAVKLNSFKIEQKSFFKVFNQNVPYIKVKFSLSGKIQKNLEGIIGIINNPDKENNIIVSVNESGKFNQDIAEKFFKSIEFNGNG
ncbi:MAG: hypothetical protein V2B14_01195 [bacterium]